MMDHILSMIQHHVQYAPWIAFGALMLAGFNIPVSEDATIIICASLAAKYPEQKVPLFLGAYAGAYLSDLVAYTIGRKLGPHLWDIKWFANMVSKSMVTKIGHYYDRYGVITLIFGRFIPFGVRNGLFMTAGLGKMRFAKFAAADLLACTISNLTLFTLTYKLGKKFMLGQVAQANKIIFILALIIITIILLVTYGKKKSRSKK
jgi:membrane-associated protein